jgi:hypothetical protein
VNVVTAAGLFVVHLLWFGAGVMVLSLPDGSLVRIEGTRLSLLIGQYVLLVTGICVFALQARIRELAATVAEVKEGLTSYGDREGRMTERLRRKEAKDVERDTEARTEREEVADELEEYRREVAENLEGHRKEDATDLEHNLISRAERMERNLKGIEMRVFTRFDQDRQDLAALSKKLDDIRGLLKEVNDRKSQE